MAEARVTAAERERDRAIKAARLRSLRYSYQQIAAELGYADDSGAYRAAQRGFKLAVREPHEDMVLLDLAELDEMAQEAWKVLRATHYVVDRGAVVKWNDAPLTDDAPVLAAISRLLDIQSRRSKLLGLDAPKRVEVSEGISDLDAAVKQLAAELALGSQDSEVPAE